MFARTGQRWWLECNSAVCVCVPLHVHTHTLSMQEALGTIASCMLVLIHMPAILALWRMNLGGSLGYKRPHLKQTVLGAY